MLLRDIKHIFEERDRLRLFSSDLVDALVEMEERPWCEWKRGQPMTQNSLAKILATFSIKSKRMRIGNINQRGFEIKQFQDVFKRYIPEQVKQSGTVEQLSNSAAFSGFQSGTKITSVPLSKTATSHG